MKYLILLLISLAGTGVWAQDTSLHFRKVTYQVKLITTSDSVISGYLRLVGDSSVRICFIPVRYGAPCGYTKDIAYQQIRSLRIRRDGRIRRGALLGIVGGSLLGALIGWIAYQPPDCNGSYFCIDFGPGLSALAGLATGTLAGAGLGVALGAASGMEFLTAGTYEGFSQMKAAITKRVSTGATKTPE
ncbi:hypothetical protein V9K67_11275 [Paraflavisolibacter sp. H34]|uniref:hypothetical protein n=1 Tax=Huijunlia imazamoxiresistens TaxID=3127457 RepID=UPI003019B12C